MSFSFVTNMFFNTDHLLSSYRFSGECQDDMTQFTNLTFYKARLKQNALRFLTKLRLKF